MCKIRIDLKLLHDVNAYLYDVHKLSDNDELCLL